MVSYKIQTVRSKKGVDLQLAYLEGNTFEYKDIIKKYGGTFDPTRKRWFWWLGETPEQVENIINNKVKPCIEKINGGQTSENTETSEVNGEVEGVIKTVDDCIDKVSGSGMDNEEEVKKRLQSFKEELINITSSEEFQQKMEPIIKFRMANDYQYSIGNTILIWIQDPEAKIVKSKSGWAKYNREILPNAKKIWLWMPVPVPFTKTEREEKIKEYLKTVGVRYYRDLSEEQKESLNEILKKGKGSVPRLFNYWTDHRFTKQMDGKEDKLGSPNSNLEWFEDGDSDKNTEKLFDSLLEVVQEKGINIEYTDDLGGARGVSSSGKITLLANQPKNIGMVNTLCHEFAHELLHQKFLKSKDENLGSYFVGTKEGRSKVEQQAELCAWIVLKEFGYDMPTNINYVGIWGLNKNNAVKVFDSVASVATFIADNIKKKILNNAPMQESKNYLKEHVITGLDVAKMIGCEDIYLQSAENQENNMLDNVVTESIKRFLKENFEEEEEINIVKKLKDKNGRVHEVEIYLERYQDEDGSYILDGNYEWSCGSSYLEGILRIQNNEVIDYDGCFELPSAVYKVLEMEGLINK